MGNNIRTTINRYNFVTADIN